MPAISASGNLILVNQQTAQRQLQVVTTARADGFAAVWVSPITNASRISDSYANADIKGRLFNADGSPAGDEFTVNSGTAGIQYRPDVTTLANGNLLVTWQDGTTTVTIKARELTANGTPIGDDFVIAGPGGLTFSTVAALAGGGFVAAWLGGGNTVVQRFDASHAKVGDPILIANSSLGSDLPSVTALSNGNFVVTFLKTAFDGSAARMFDAAGNQIGSDIALRFTGIIADLNEVYDAQVTALAGGGFVLTGATSAGVGYSVRNANGVETALGLLRAGNGGYDVVATATGDFVITYLTGGPDPELGQSVLTASLISASGNVIGNPVIVNSRDGTVQSLPMLSRLADGDIIVAWNDQVGDGDDFGINARLLDITPGAAPQELFLRLADSDLLTWDSTQGSQGFTYLFDLDPTSSVVAVGDFTGDDRGDIVFRQANGGYISWNIAQGGAGFRALPDFGSAVPIHAADLRGDAAEELLLRSPDGQLRILDVGSGVATDLLKLSPGFSVVGVGNIDNQGRDDIIFKNDNSGAIFAFTDFGFVDLLTLGTGWNVVGFGNVTGNAADDMILRNADTGVTIFWDVGQGGGGFRDFATVGNEWAFRAFADLNGDGRDDVLLQNSNGNAIYWTGTNWGDLGNVLANVQLVGITEFG